MAGKTDLELQKYTSVFKEKIKKGVREEELLVEAFAVMREADRRVLQLFPTDEQILGAIAIYYGNIAEVKTGEGKSLIATLPLYLKALHGQTAFLVTTNNYLAHRDYERIGNVYRWLGISVADGSQSNEEEFDIEQKKIMYSASVIYISNSTLAFDFLINGLAESSSERYMPQLDFALLDEVDEILLDGAQMPLIISGAPKIQSNYFEVSNSFVELLIQGKDFEIDEERQNVWLTPKGIEYAKQYFSVNNLLDQAYFTLYQHIIIALKAHYILKKGKNYLVEEGKVKLLDHKNGRILEGSNLQSGLHQALEAKEQVEITQETQIISSITYQNLFRKFSSLAGMSGTAKVAESEFINTYNLPVKKIRTHKKSIRIDHKPKQYVTFKAKIEAVLKKIIDLHSTGRPLLIIAGSVDASELLSMHLLDKGIPHNVLNAKNSSKEAKIIKEAGRVGAITVATAMAGRGTDIKMEHEAIERGGLVVIITERMLNKRIELQAKGRAGRQGEPGETYVFESLEDDIIKLFVQEKVQKYYDKHLLSSSEVRSRKIRKSFYQAQKIAEEKAENERIKALQFDEVFLLQKRMIDKSREEIIRLSNINEAIVFFETHARIALDNFFFKRKSANELQRFILDYVDYNFKKNTLESEKEEIISQVNYVLNLVKNSLYHKRKQINDDETFFHYLQITMLKALDTIWSEQVDALNQLRVVVESRTTAQKKAIFEFETEAQRSYKLRQKEVSKLILKNVTLSTIEIKKEELIITFP